MANDTPHGPGSGSASEAPASPSSARSAEPPQVVLDSQQVKRSLLRIAHEIVERNDHLENLYLVGVPNGGVPLARQLAAHLEEICGIEPVLGVLDTTLYRDDLVSSGKRPRLRRTEMPSAVDERVVILIDDVCSTGRTIRAAMDALMDFGRPQAVQVVALVDRGHRELPIKIDYVGKNIPTQRGDRVQMRVVDGDPGEGLEVILISAAAGGAGS